MRVGILFPQNDLAGDVEALRTVGRAAEELGYTTLHLADHVLGTEHADREPPLAGRDDEHDPFFDPFTAMAYLSAVTTGIELATCVLVLPQRPTALVAQQTADVDLMSGGRVRLGIGVGWNHVEYQALGQSFGTRGARLDEQIPLLRRLWTEPLVTFHGRFDHIERACVNPRPRRPIPLWFGGFGEPAFRRAVRVGDGFVFSGSPEQAHAALARVRRMLDEAGRDPSTFGLELLVRVETAAELARHVTAWQEAGGTDLALTTTHLGRGSLAQQLDLMHELRGETVRAVGSG
ncbi:hypothetical protein GCM10009836_42140 [Pseudonocardia ailaonensis]|uniref:Luciferase-like domain-containing protein n=1 Tax=Pseudonocardia ailaonensis TaxID=367279 RepID=A0ABN2N8F0_9PSEU